MTCPFEMLPASPRCAIRLPNLVRKARRAADQCRELREHVYYCLRADSEAGTGSAGCRQNSQKLLISKYVYPSTQVFARPCHTVLSTISEGTVICLRRGSCSETTAECLLQAHWFDERHPSQQTIADDEAMQKRARWNTVFQKYLATI